MGIALDIYRRRQFAEGKAEGLAQGQAERDALRRRIAELESRNGNSPDDTHPDESDEE